MCLLLILSDHQNNSSLVTEVVQYDCCLAQLRPGIHKRIKIEFKFEILKFVVKKRNRPLQAQGWNIEWPNLNNVNFLQWAGCETLKLFIVPHFFNIS